MDELMNNNQELSSTNYIIECLNITIIELRKEISKLCIENTHLKNQLSKNSSISNKILLLTIDNNKLKSIQYKYNELLLNENILKTTIVNLQNENKILQEKNDKLNNMYSYNLLNKNVKHDKNVKIYNEYIKLKDELKRPNSYILLKNKFDSLILLITELDMSKLTDDKFYTKFKEALILKVLKILYDL